MPYDKPLGVEDHSVCGDPDNWLSVEIFRLHISPNVDKVQSFIHIRS